MLKLTYIEGFFDELDKLAEEKPKEVFKKTFGRLVRRKASRAVARKAGPVGRVLGPASRYAEIKMREKKPPSMKRRLKKLERRVEKGVKEVSEPAKVLKGVTRAGQMSWAWGSGGPQRVAKRLAIEVPGVVAKLKEKKGSSVPEKYQWVGLRHNEPAPPGVEVQRFYIPGTGTWERRRRKTKEEIRRVAGYIDKAKSLSIEKKSYDQQAQFKAQMNQLLSLMKKRVAGKPNIFGEGGTRRALTLNFPQTRAAAEFERMRGMP
jgi:hypothetical protein